MGIFSRKDKSSSVASGSTRHNSSVAPSVGDVKSVSSQTSLKSPITPAYNTRMSFPKIALPKAPDAHVDPAGYLRSIGSVRERCTIMLEKAQKNNLNHFDVDMSMFDATTKFVVSIIKVNIYTTPHFSIIHQLSSFNAGSPTTARLCTRLCEYPSTWPMATFQCRWSRPYRGAPENLAKERRSIRTMPQTARSLPRLGPARCRRWHIMVVQEY